MEANHTSCCIGEVKGQRIVSEEGSQGDGREGTHQTCGPSHQFDHLHQKS